MEDIEDMIEDQMNDLLEEKEGQGETKGCAYCGNNDPNSLIECVETGKLFCNNELEGVGSHIMIHLVW